MVYSDDIIFLLFACAQYKWPEYANIILWFSPSHYIRLNKCSIDLAVRRDYNELYQHWFFRYSVRDAPAVESVCWIVERLGLTDKNMSSHYTHILQVINAIPNFLNLCWKLTTYGLYSVILFAVVLIAVVGYIVYRWTKGRKGIHVSSPILPFSITKLKDAFNTMTEEFVPAVSKKKGHLKLASVRKQLERFCIDFCFRYSKKVRDIGGSLTRNKQYGKKLHICFPDITPNDHSCRQKAGFPLANDVVFHSLQDCTWNSLSVMSYVDFHISLSDLADHIQAPTLMITHDFAAMNGDFDWYDGECKGIVTDNLVTMTTRQGETYSHPYHSWKNQGFISGTKSIVQYIIIGEYEHSSVYLLYPGTGDFVLDDASCLKDNAQTGYNLNGVDCCLIDDDFHFRSGEVFHGKVKASTINRVAYSLSTVKRDDVYAHNLTNLLKGRMTSDKQDPNVAHYARMLVSHLADRMALESGHTYLCLPTTVVGMSFVPRMYYWCAIWVCRSAPQYIGKFCQMLVSKIVGTKKCDSMLPHTWETTMTPNYELHDMDDDGTTEAGEGRKIRHKHPFRAGGSVVDAGPDREQQCNTLQHVQQPVSKCEDQGDSIAIKNPPKPATRRRAPRRNNNTSKHPITPVPMPRLSIRNNSAKSALNCDGLARGNSERGSRERRRNNLQYATRRLSRQSDDGIFDITPKPMVTKRQSTASCGGVGVEVPSGTSSDAVKSTQQRPDERPQQ